ncbi:T9SS type A sorting domain-containing protein [bacterium]|nr:T9SS type A sorting domain-containing protein [bacterium]
MQGLDPKEHYEGTIHSHNPNDEFLEINGVPDNTEVEVSVLNADGAVILEKIKVKNKRLYVRFLEPGQYTLMIHGDDLNSIGRFVKY